MSLFVIADPHLSFSSNKSMDIFKGWSDYTSRLRDNWQSAVSENDTVVVPGDISWAMNIEEALNDFKFLNSLNGRKIILKGNHDYWWTTKSKADKFFEANGLTTLNVLNNNFYSYEDIGICGTRGWINDGSEPADAKVIRREAMRLERSIQGAVQSGLYPVVFMHYPPVFAESINDDIMEVLIKYGIKLCFYGHLHGASCSLAVNGIKFGIDFRLISSDYLHFMPCNITEIVQDTKKAFCYRK
ncbi:MAG TPA: metallophosphoesterase [Candidatus Faeciplasma gallinarum]|uniref:Metallophosphoesterase n=1 Tax=Candidatus Faeciplasma gallinarum TaxID=2840799 RepID=A0A9D1JHP3_9FIRM|nr:metallophosphoesterase [Candidatus Faeciplasma gallinarum]